jgi:DNA-binding NarL/FixJ family response regulator
MSQAGALKIIIAEEQAGLRRVIRTVIDGLAGEIRDCLTPRDLELACAAWKPDFVLIDAEMKTLDSIAAVRSITNAIPSARVIVVSGYDSAELREAVMRAGAAAYVMKENLLEIGRLLASHR